MLGQISVDGSLQVGDRAEDAAADALAGHVAKEVFERVSHETEVGVKWKVQRGWRDSQANTLGCS